MSFSSPLFILAIIAITTIGWVMTTSIRARHGYPLTDDWGNPVHPVNKDDEAAKALIDENKQLKANVERLEERLKVLERIATDPTKRLSDEIDGLR